MECNIIPTPLNHIVHQWKFTQVRAELYAKKVNSKHFSSKLKFVTIIVILDVQRLGRINFNPKDDERKLADYYLKS